MKDNTCLSGDKVKLLSIEDRKTYLTIRHLKFENRKSKILPAP